MRTELLSGETNVLRFPTELRARPTLELLRDIALDVREVLAVADGFDLALPVHDLRDRVDAETAEHIANQVPTGGQARTAMLTEMLDPLVAAAIAACRAANDSVVEAAEARQRVRQAQATGHVWLDVLQAKADALSLRAAELMVTAHTRAEEAEGVARAVGLARRCELWSPRNFETDIQALLAFGRAV